MAAVYNPHYPANEPTYRQPYIDLRLHRAGFRGLRLPMHQFLRSFGMQWGVDSSYAATIGIFDPDYDRVEQYVHAAGAGTEVTFSFGWRDITVSREYYGLLKQYASKVTPGGTEMELTIQSPIAAVSAARADIVFGVMAVDDAVNFVCDRLGIPSTKRIIEPTVRTAVRIPDFIGSEGVTFLYWLNDIKPLAVSARSELEGRDYGPYSWTFDPDGTFRFTTLARHDGVNLRLYDIYTYGFASDGRVLSMELVDSRPMLALTGGQYVTSRSVNPDDPTDARTNVSPTDGLSSTPTEGQGMSPQEQNLDERFSHYLVPEIAESQDEALLRAISKWRLYTGYNFKINIVILGDPHVRFGDFIYIRIIKRDGTPHFMSGIYAIMNIVHNIDSSKFTTSMTCIRRASFLNDTQSANVTIPDEIGGQIERTLPVVSVSPGARFQLGRYYYDTVREDSVLDEGSELEVGPNVTAAVPDYEPPTPGGRNAPWRNIPVEAEEER